MIKAYFRLPLALIEEVTRVAHARGIPVTAHLEIVDAGDAIRAGIDGLEHVTSAGVALLPPREGEAYRQVVLADNAARSVGRYRVWSQLDLKSERASRLLKLMVSRNVTLSPTLAVFERRQRRQGQSPRCTSKDFAKWSLSQDRLNAPVFELWWARTLQFHTRNAAGPISVRWNCLWKRA